MTNQQTPPGPWAGGKTVTLEPRPDVRAQVEDNFKKAREEHLAAGSAVIEANRIFVEVLDDTEQSAGWSVGLWRALDNVRAAAREHRRATRALDQATQELLLQGRVA